MEDPGVITSPRPGPICSCNDFAIPALAVLGACVRSVSWPITRAGDRQTSRATLQRLKFISSLQLRRDVNLSFGIARHDRTRAFCSVPKASYVPTSAGLIDLDT